jgi:hypothetical protein
MQDPSKAKFAGSALYPASRQMSSGPSGLCALRPVGEPLQNARNASIIRQFTKEAVLRVAYAISFVIALIETCAPASASEALPETGAAKLAAYQVCHPLTAVDMGAAGSETFTECSGIVRNLDTQNTLDNLSIHCMEDATSRPEGYRYAGTCVQTDGDQDKLFMTYEGSAVGKIKWIGGTGKYKDVSGAGSLGVVVAPGGTSNSFAYTLTYDVAWTHKAK